MIMSGHTQLTEAQLRHRAPSVFAQQAHESRSDKYAYIPTVDVLHAMMREGFVPTYATQSRSRDASKREHTKHMLRFRHQSNDSAQVGDTVPEVILVNSHDGTSAYKLMSGLFRVVCLNGLVTGDTYQALSVPHKGDAIRSVIEGSFEVIQDAQKARNEGALMSRLTLSRDEQIAFATAAHTLRFDEDGAQAEAIKPESLLTLRRRDDNGTDLFTSFNRIQENVIRGGLHGWARDEQGRRTRRVTTREVKGVSQQVALNRALWTLAEEMKKLKA